MGPMETYTAPRNVLLKHSCGKADGQFQSLVALRVTVHSAARLNAPQRKRTGHFDSGQVGGERRVFVGGRRLPEQKRARVA